MRSCRKRFRSERLQRAYATARKLAAEGKLIGGSSEDAYKRGYAGVGAMPVRTSIAYAAWRAGADDKKDGRPSAPMPT